MAIVDPPNVERQILPALPTEHINQLIDQFVSVRDKVSLAPREYAENIREILTAVGL
jgi:hypothetical protein